MIRCETVLNPHIFRAYDVRGRVGSDINPDVFRRVGRAYATLVRRAPPAWTWWTSAP